MSYWPVICLVLSSITAVLGFGAGAATGSTMNGVDFKDVFIPMFSALGGWVSGAGALAAVGTTLYLYRKQEEENEEELEVIVYAEYGAIRVDVTCLSRHPAFVTDIFFEFDDATYWMSKSDVKQLNSRISYKEMKTFDLNLFQREIERFAGVDLMANTDKLSVETTFGDYDPDRNYLLPKT